MIRVLIVDDHEVVRMGLQALLDETEDIVVVGSASNGAEACDQAAEHTPDVILMDLSMPIMDGVEATQRILAANSDIHIVVLTSFSDRTKVLAAIDAGASGYQLKDAETDTLLATVRSAAAGQVPLDPRVAKALIGSRRVQPNQTTELTDRETDVLRLLGSGLLNKQIARRLGVTESTVKTHLTSIFSRIGVSDRTQAALWAQKQGLLADS